jgi:hypothetical protein
MKVIGKRISILKKENLLSIVILPTTDKKKLTLLFLWILAWTTCGIIVFINYFKLLDENIKLFTIGYLSFWFYFEYTIVKAFIWKKFGKEKLWIQDGLINYQKEINKKGKIQTFNIGLIENLSLVEINPTSFMDTINQSFWVKGGERIEFKSQAKTIRLGMQITDEEALLLIKEINSALNIE